MTQPDFPELIGVFRAVEQNSFDALVHGQIAQPRSASAALTRSSFRLKV